jgi:MFS family permease
MLHPRDSQAADPASAPARAGQRPGERHEPATGQRFALFVLFAINLLNFYDRQLLGALGEPVRKEFLLSDTAFALLGTVFTLVYAAVGLPLGRLSDRWYRNRLIAIATAVWSLLTAATGMATTYAQLVITRISMGVGEASFAPAGQSLIGDLFPPAKRALAMGIFMLGLPAGVFVAYATSGVIYEHFGWRRAFFVACLPGLILAALALALREPRRGGMDEDGHGGRIGALAGSSGGAGPRGSHGSMRSYAAVLKLPTMWWIILSGVFHNFNMYALNSFSSAFLQRFHGMSVRGASSASSIAVGAVGAVGLLVGGYWADRMSIKRPNARLLVAAWCMSLAAPCIFLALYQPKGAIDAYVVLMAMGTIGMYVYYATVYAAIQDVVEPGLRGIAVAIYFCCMYVFGASLGPVGTGLLSDRFARRAMQDAGATRMTEAFKAIGLHDAMYVVPLLAVLAAVVLFMGARSMPGDMRKREFTPSPAKSR